MIDLLICAVAAACLKPFQVTAVKVGEVHNPKTGAPTCNDVGHATIKTVDDLIRFGAAEKLRQIVPAPSLAVQAMVLAAEWTGNLTNEPEEDEGIKAGFAKTNVEGGDACSKILIQHMGGGIYCVVPVSQEGVKLEYLVGSEGAILMDHAAACRLADKYRQCGFSHTIPVEEV